jgi:molybdenum cofactor cytidylyltransferase
MIRGVVLAAGESRRMGHPKALLADPAGTPFVVRIVDTLATAGITDLVVVTGTHHDEISRALRARPPAVPIDIVRNPQPERGQLSSLLCGLAAGAEPDALLVTLVDVPMVSAKTVRELLDVWCRRRAAIVRPAMAGRHGHPVIFDRRTLAALRSAPLAEGARTVVRAFADEAENVQVDDAGCLRDVDTPEEYARLIQGSSA